MRTNIIMRDHKLKITVIGTGYVGLVSGTCFAEMGHDVTCVDKIKAKIDTLLEGGIPIFEPGLEELVRKNTQSGNLNFSLELAKHARQSDAIFIAVGTPPHPVTGHADMKYVHAVAAELAECIEGRGLALWCFLHKPI